MIAMKIVKSGFDEKFFTKVSRKNFNQVLLQKVHQICLDIFSQPATITWSGFSFFN